MTADELDIAMDAALLASAARQDARRTMRLTDDECRHRRLPGDRTPPCGCFPDELDVSPSPGASSPGASQTREGVGRS